MSFGADIRPGDRIQFHGVQDWRTVVRVDSDPHTGSLLTVRVRHKRDLPSVYSVGRGQPVTLRFPEPDPARYSITTHSRATPRRLAQAIVDLRNSRMGTDGYSVRPSTDIRWWDVVLILPRPCASDERA